MKTIVYCFKCGLQEHGHDNMVCEGFFDKEDWYDYLDNEDRRYRDFVDDREGYNDYC